MNTKKLTHDIVMKKKIKDYSFLIAFFLIFSFFVFFAIKPNLETAFSLKKEYAELKQLDEAYDVAIGQIISVQTTLSTHRDEMHLLDQALPQSPQVNKVFADLQRSSSASAVPILKVGVTEVGLKKLDEQKEASLESYIVNFETLAPFASVQEFIKNLNSQRRIKIVKRMDIVKDAESSQSANLQVILEISGYYL